MEVLELPKRPASAAPEECEIHMAKLTLCVFYVCDRLHHTNTFVLNIYVV